MNRTMIFAATCVFLATLVDQARAQTCSLSISPASIERVAKLTGTVYEVDEPLTLQSMCSGQIFFTNVYVVEDSATVPGGAGWLEISGAPFVLEPVASAQMTVYLNRNNTIQHSGVYYGRIVFEYDPNAQTLTVPIAFRMLKNDWAPSFAVWDTITTQCGLPLAVSNIGNMGANYIGGANLGFPSPSPECDTGGNRRGDAGIYLGDASPIVVRQISPGSYAASWAMISDDTAYSHTFRPLTGFVAPGFFSAANWQGYNSGTFCTSDSLVKVEKTWWAPSGASAADSCKFIIMRTKYYPFTSGQSVSALALGDAFDFDVASDSGTSNNVGGTDPTRRMVYMRGFNSADTVTDCYDNSRRYAGAAVIKMHTKGMVDQAFFGAYNAANDSFVYPQGGFVPQQLWENMQASGYSNETRITDLHSVLIYKNVATTGYTLPANDTLFVYTAIAVVRPAGGTTAQGLDTLKKEIDKAINWYKNVMAPIFCAGNCVGKTGNVNGSASETPDLSDLSVLVAWLTTGPFYLPKPAEANINTFPEPCSPPDLSDLSLLIAYLTVTPPPTLPDCR